MPISLHEGHGLSGLLSLVHEDELSGEFKTGVLVTALETPLPLKAHVSALLPGVHISVHLVSPPTSGVGVSLDMVSATFSQRQREEHCVRPEAHCRNEGKKQEETFSCT